jgi:hypothetical protein
MKNDIQPHDKNLVNISEIGKYGKFVEVCEILEESLDRKISRTGEFKLKSGVLFQSNDFNKEKITQEECKDSLKRMSEYLEKHIKIEIELETSNIKFEVENKIREKYLKSMQQNGADS